MILSILVIVPLAASIVSFFMKKQTLMLGRVAFGAVAIELVCALLAVARVSHEGVYASAGIFSLAFRDARHGIAVGGDYAKDSEDRRNIALTNDGGRTWEAVSNAGPKGFRSAVAWLPRLWIVTGTSGSDVSRDNGNTWKLFDSGAYNAMSFVPGGDGWAVGPQGRIARFQSPTH